MTSELARSAAEDKLNRFWGCQVWRRRKRLITVQRAAVAVAVGGLAAYVLPTAGNQTTLVSQLGFTALTFATISFGACLTGAVLALTVPSEDQRSALSGSSLPGTDFSHFSDLIFVFTWSAMSQLAVTGAAVGLYLVAASARPSPRPHVDLGIRIFLGVLGSVSVYAVGQLTAVIKTISQLANVVTKVRQ